MKTVEKAAASGGSQVSVVVLLLVLMMVSSCISKKPVYVPSEWQPPPATQPAVVQPVSPPTPVPKETAILKPAPVIKETDLAPASEAPAVAPEKKPAQPIEKKPAQPPPQQQASMQLVNRAKALMAQGKTDSAIPLLEKAIQVDQRNGEAFFNLARAWRSKGSRQKAIQFAQKSEILFQGDSTKLKQAYLLQADLYKEMGNAAKSDSYRQKASKLK